MSKSMGIIPRIELALHSFDEMSYNYIIIFEYVKTPSDGNGNTLCNWTGTYPLKAYDVYVYDYDLVSDLISFLTISICWFAASEHLNTPSNRILSLGIWLMYIWLFTKLYVNIFYERFTTVFVTSSIYLFRTGLYLSSNRVHTWITVL